MDQGDWELLHQQMQTSGLKRHGGLLGLCMLIVFFAGLALGSSLFSHQPPNQEFASGQLDGSPQPF